MQDTPTSRIRSAAQGYVELDGIGDLMGGEQILSPLSLKRCTWFSFEIERKEVYYRDGKRKTRWETIRSGISEALFLLVDDTGRCVIDPDGAEVKPSVNRVWYGNSSSAIPPPHKTGFLSQCMGFGDYRYTEKLMLPGDRLYALGFFKTVGTGSETAEFNEDIKALLREWKSNPEKHLAHFDENKDGKIDQQEWLLVRKAARQWVEKNRAELNAGLSDNIMLKPMDGRRPYLLSSVSEEDMLKHFRWRIWGSLALAIMLGTILLLMIFPD